MIQEEHRYNPLDGDRYAAAHTQASPALRSEALRVTVPHTLVLFFSCSLQSGPLKSLWLSPCLAGSDFGGPVRLER